MAQDIETFSVCCHDAVLNTVMNHLHKVSSSMWSAMEIALLSSTVDLFPSRCTTNRLNAGSQGREDRIEMLNYFILATDHLAIAALQTPDTTAGAAVHIMDTI